MAVDRMTSGGRDQAERGPGPGQPGPVERCRMFVAVDLGQDATAAIRAALPRWSRHFPERTVRWSPAIQWHITLHFLGDVEAVRLAALETALRQALAGSPAIPLQLGTLGAFPSLEAPRVLWLGLEGDVPALGELQERTVCACAGFGEATVPREFHPHLTLGRVSRPDPRVARAWRAVAASPTPLAPCPWRVERVHLYQSQLQPGGAVHTRRAVYALV